MTNGFQNTGRDLHELFTIPAENTLFLHALLHCIFKAWLRSHVKNSCFVFHHGFQAPRNNKSTRPAASCFQQCSRVWNPDENRCTSFWKSSSSHQELLNIPQRWSARVPKVLFPTLMESSRLFLFWITFVALSNLSGHVQFVIWLSFGPTWKFLFWLTQSEVNSVDRKHYD